MLKIKKDVDLICEVDQYDVLLVGTNVYGRLTNGWQLDAKLKYPRVHEANMNTKYGDVKKMGTVVRVEQEDAPTICICYITKGYNFRPDKESDYLSYEALESCLYSINILFKGKKVACPILGTSMFDGNGDKERVIKLFETTLCDVNLTLYDYAQTSANDKHLALIKDVMEGKRIWKETRNRKPYYDAVMRRKDYEKRLKDINNLTIFK